MPKAYRIYPPPYDDIVISRAMGVHIFDENGKKYTDLSGSAGMAILGYNDNRINQLIKRQIGKLTIAPQKYRTPERDALAGKLLSLFPPEYNAVIPTVTGSETVEAAMQLAMQKTGRGGFISFDCAYHGRTIAAGSLGRGDEGYGILKDRFDTVAPPRADKEVDKAIAGIEKKFIADKYAAFIAEGVITNGGYLLPPVRFYHKLQALCRRYGVLLVFDEVLTGFGRTGRVFSFEHHSVKPDIVCLSKGIAAGYAAMGAVVTTDKLARGYECYSAYTWPPLGCVIGVLVIDTIVKDKLAIRSRELGEKSLKLLKKYLTGCPIVKSINGVGLGIALKLNSPVIANKVYITCRGSGVILFRKLDVNLLTIQPPLIIKEKVLTDSVKKIIMAVIGVSKNEK